MKKIFIGFAISTLLLFTISACDSFSVKNVNVPDDTDVTREFTFEAYADGTSLDSTEEWEVL